MLYILIGILIGVLIYNTVLVLSRVRRDIQTAKMLKEGGPVKPGHTSLILHKLLKDLNYDHYVITFDFPKEQQGGVLFNANPKVFFNDLLPGFLMSAHKYARHHKSPQELIVALEDVLSVLLNKENDRVVKVSRTDTE